MRWSLILCADFSVAVDLFVQSRSPRQPQKSGRHMATQGWRISRQIGIPITDGEGYFSAQDAAPSAAAAIGHSVRIFSGAVPEVECHTLHITKPEAVPVLYH